MTSSTTGRCLCGAISFRFDEAPIGTRACWCRDCQYMATGNASLSAFFRTATFSITGAPKEYFRRSDAGNLIRHRFCPDCGTQLFIDAVGHSDVMIVRIGTLDDREIGAPQTQIWTASAPGWAHIAPDIPHFPGPPGSSK